MNDHFTDIWFNSFTDWLTYHGTWAISNDGNRRVQNLISALWWMQTWLYTSYGKLGRLMLEQVCQRCNMFTVN